MGKDLRRHPRKDGQGQRTAAHDPGLGAADGRAAHRGLRAAQADGALGAMAVVAGGPVGVSKNPRDARLRQGRGLYQRLGRGITGHAPLLLRPRHRDPRGLRPDRDDRARLVQPAGWRTFRHGRASLARRRNPNRLRRRDPREGQQRVRRLLQGSEEHQGDVYRRLAENRRHRRARQRRLLEDH